MHKSALIAAALSAALGVSLLYVYLDRFEEEASGGVPVRVLVALRDIPLGTSLTKAYVGERTLPSAYVEDRHIRAADAERVIGVRVSTAVRANESILWTDLATTSEQRRDLSALVRNGMRAMTIRADATSSFGGLLRAGDRVDVFMTSGRGEAGERATIPLLQNVLVLAVGADTGGDDGSPNGGRETRITRYNQVTLSVTLEQASILTFAAQTGALSLVLRNPDDIAVLEGLPETTAADIREPEKRERLIRRERPIETPTVPSRIQ